MEVATPKRTVQTRWEISHVPADRGIVEMDLPVQVIKYNYVFIFALRVLSMPFECY